jgi:hypothetical protein
MIMMRTTILATLCLATVALGGCDEMKAGFEKGYAEGKARAEADKAKADQAETPAPDTAETPEKAATPAS